jgi:ATP-binding cassette subfamily F protein 3
LKRELGEIDQRLATLQQEKAKQEERLQHTKVPADIADAGKRLKQISTETETLEERWLKLSAELEALG